MGFLQTVHGEMRWIVALVGIIAIILFAIGWLRRTPYRPLDRGLMTGYTVAMDLNVTLGLIVLIVLGLQQGIWPAQRLEHAVTMIVAAVVAHLSLRWRNAPDDALKYRNNLLAVLGSLLLVFVGVLRLRGGWMF